MKHMKNQARVLACALPALALVGCENQKSSNPLSPTVAGPIPGIQITAPKLLEPNGNRIPVDQQPVTLLIENASTNGPRPLTYTVEVAADAGFSNKVFQRAGVPPGEGGRTTLRLPDALASGRSYYWRARAEDGANTGPYTGPANFDVFTPIVIDKPALVSPAQNENVTTLRPKLVFNNVTRSGPVGPISYVIEVSTTFTFAADAYAIGPVAEQPGGRTTVDPPRDGTYSTYVYWHVRATDGTNVGPWSDVWAFMLPPKPAPTPAPGPAPGPGGPSKCTFVDRMADNSCFIAEAKADLLAQGANLSGDCGAWSIIQLAVQRMGHGAGYKIKSGTNCNGYSIKSVMFPDGADFLVLISPGTVNGPTWEFFGFSDPSTYAPPR